MTALKGPLDGIRVIDMSSVFVGPLAAMYLGDLGADVIKVEHPRSPDAGRFMGTRLKRKDGSDGDTSVYLAANRNGPSSLTGPSRTDGLSLKD
jgi:crotonobetainyl-CoA:carnitine CoA-transferase CaiB-like acyl-CoA transferase